MDLITPTGVGPGSPAAATIDQFNLLLKQAAASGIPVDPAIARGFQQAVNSRSVAGMRSYSEHLDGVLRQSAPAAKAAGDRQARLAEQIGSLKALGAAAESNGVKISETTLNSINVAAGKGDTAALATHIDLLKGDIQKNTPSEFEAESRKQAAIDKAVAAEEAAKKKADELRQSASQIADLYGLAQNLKEHPHFTNAFGANANRYNPFTYGDKDAIALKERISDNAFIKGIHAAKAAGLSGAISDAEGAKISGAATILGKGISDEQAQKELHRMQVSLRTEYERLTGKPIREDPSAKIYGNQYPGEAPADPGPPRADSATPGTSDLLKTWQNRPSQ